MWNAGAISLGHSVHGILVLANIEQAMLMMVLLKHSAMLLSSGVCVAVQVDVQYCAAQGTPETHDLCIYCCCPNRGCTQ